MTTVTRADDDGRSASATAVTDGGGDAVDARPGLVIGRYQLLTPVGAGGMGVVWGAWDPELERRVAIKLVQARAEARTRILREGRTLARVSHPNIVPLYDVGVVGETLYLVMEWVRGSTLRELDDDVLDAYRQAGAGLAAAHAAGVIHRDFKPDNAIRGDDGRVRVLDFGLAIDEGTGAGAGERAGTRRYMAPEQARGEPVTAASDQYAFAVALGEALARRGEVPRWLAAIVARGRAEEPGARYPSMRELLAALARDPAARRRRALIAGVALAVVAAAFVIGRARAHAVEPVVETCSGGAEELAPIWSAARRDPVLAPLRAVRGPADVDGVVGALDRFATAWVGEHARACRAKQRAELTAGLYEERRACLARTRARLDAVVDVLGRVDRASADGAVLAARSLPDPAGCADAPSAIPPPSDRAAAVRALDQRLEVALVHMQAGEADAGPLVDAGLRSARALGYAPLLARALLLAGRAADRRRLDEAETEAYFTEAMTTALTTGQDALAVEAYARWLFTNAYNGHTDDGSWTAIAAIADRLGPRDRATRAILLNNRAIGQRARGDRGGARELLRAALVARGPDESTELLAIEANLAAIVSSAEEARAFARINHERLVAALGPGHWRTARAEIVVAMLEPDLAAAQQRLTAACETLAANPVLQDGGLCWFQVGWIAVRNGDRDAALAALARVPAPTGGLGDHYPRLAETLLAVERGDRRGPALVEALDRYERAVVPEADWERSTSGEKAAVVAWSAARIGRLAMASASWRRAVEHLRASDLGIDAGPRALAEARLAELVAGRDRAEARALAASALTWYRLSPGDAALTARLEALAR